MDSFGVDGGSGAHDAMDWTYLYEVGVSICCGVVGV